jgi:hypothetical protein
MNQEFESVLARTKALVAESRQVKLANRHVCSQAWEAALSARAQLEKYRESLRSTSQSGGVSS